MTISIHYFENQNPTLLSSQKKANVRDRTLLHSSRSDINRRVTTLDPIIASRNTVHREGNLDLGKVITASATGQLNVLMVVDEIAPLHSDNRNENIVAMAEYQKQAFKKKVYVPLAVDFLHEGHINILRIAKKYGDVIVGLLTDEAIANYKSIPMLDYKNRELLVENLKYVSKVVPQKTEDYSYNLNKIKPNFFVHGDDWKYDNRKKTRAKVIKMLPVLLSFSLHK